MTRHLVHIGDLLDRQPQTRACLEQRRAEAALHEGVRLLLPGPLRPHCVDSQIRAGSLVLWVDSAAWATRARFLARDLLQALAATGAVGCGIERLEVQVRPRPSARSGRHAAADRPRLSAAAAAHLRDAASSMGDALLAESLWRLASREADQPAE